MKKLFNLQAGTTGALGLGVLLLMTGGSFFYTGKQTLILVDIGHYALKFNKITGLGKTVYREGWNVKIPYFERPIIFNVQSREKEIKAETANRGKM
jgi:prohibitin 2